MEQYLSTMHDKNPLVFALLAFTLSLIPLFTMLSLVDGPDLQNEELSMLGEWFPYFVIAFIPALETLICQAFPALLIEMFSLSSRYRIVAITFPFMLGHYIPDIALASLVNGATGGLILGVCYLVCQRRSHCYAMLVTLIVHGAHNAVALALS